MQSLLSNARVFKYFYVIKTIFARHILCIISLFTCITKWYTSQILDLRFNLYDMPTLDSMVVYHILLVWFFFSIDGFDLICLIIGLKFYFDSYILLMVLNLIFTLRYEKINMFKIMLK